MGTKYHLICLRDITNKKTGEKQMTKLKALIAAGLLVVSPFALVACDQQTETEEAVEEMGDEFEDFTDGNDNSVEDAVDDAADDVEDAVDDAADEIDNRTTN